MHFVNFFNIKLKSKNFNENTKRSIDFGAIKATRSAIVK